MPPWHIDKTVGITEFENDRSLSDKEIETIVKWVDAGSPKGDPKDMPPAKVWPNEQGWNYAKISGRPSPTWSIKSLPWTQKAGANDAWWKPVVETHLTEPRWVRALEIRPSTRQGPQDHASRDRPPAAARDRSAGDESADDANGNPQPGTFMEWAVGKQGEMMRPNSGKLMLPGSKIVWDIHYSNGGEDITDTVELGIYFYPKGQEPKFRQVLHLMGGTSGTGVGALGSGRRPAAEHREGDRRLLPAARERPRRELPAAHAPARQGDDDGIDVSGRAVPGGAQTGAEADHS